ncbi:MAG: CSLREA domain-containing protein [Solirubrobacterales bacterium]
MDRTIRLASRGAVGASAHRLNSASGVGYHRRVLSSSAARLGAFAASLFAMLAIFAAPASAAEFTVTTTADSFDGACTPAKCSLRDAIEAANHDATKDTINLPAGTLRVEIPNAAKTEDTNETGDLDVQQNLVIRGAGANSTTIRANFPTSHPDRVLDAITADLTISDLTIAGGNVTEVNNDGGGGIRSVGDTLLLERVIVRDNAASGAASSAYAGGIFKEVGLLDVRDSAVIGNTAQFIGYGGGIGAVGSTTSVSLTNVTVAENKATSSFGGIYLDTGASANLAFVTVTANEAKIDDGGIGGSMEDSTLRASIVTGNIAPSGPNCGSGTGAASLGGNVGPANCGFTLASDFQTEAAALAPLSASGIPVAEPLPGSPAIDRAVAPCPTTDARGVARPQGGACDSGAAEVPVAAPPSPAAPAGGGANGQAAKAKIGGLSVTNTSFRAGPKLAGRKGKAAPVGTTIRFTLSAAANVKTDVFRLVNGRLAGGICKPVTPARRKKPRCTRQAIAGSLGSKSFDKGAGSIDFTGRIGGRNLAPGRYIVQLTVTGAGSTATTPTLHIVR